MTYNPKNLDPKRCSACVYLDASRSGMRFGTNSQCSRAPKADGFCAFHNPEKMKARADQKEKERVAEDARTSARYAREWRVRSVGTKVLDLFEKLDPNADVDVLGIYSEVKHIVHESKKESQK